MPMYKRIETAIKNAIISVNHNIEILKLIPGLGPALESDFMKNQYDDQILARVLGDSSIDLRIDSDSTNLTSDGFYTKLGHEKAEEIKELITNIEVIAKNGQLEEDEKSFKELSDILESFPIKNFSEYRTGMIDYSNKIHAKKMQEYDTLIQVL